MSLPPPMVVYPYTVSTKPMSPPMVVYPNTVPTKPTSHSNGSFGTVFIVLAAIIVISAIACFLGRLCNRRYSPPKHTFHQRERDLEYGFKNRTGNGQAHGSKPTENGEIKEAKPSENGETRANEG
ncbi:hypothetical protein HHK36_024948 [Tetracentron sinense]|uniref:Uncharacterized protein n=1 Tax=Tetracentron sinense TaxID=13715 RepID=A0A835D774_TETSI|nr:hypothetical protein HHK36_024948 [Tetracentron sinense]